MRKGLPVLAVILAVLLLAGSVQAQTLQRVRLSEVVRSIFYAPQYVAISQGIFADEGIQIELSTA